MKKKALVLLVCVLLAGNVFAEDVKQIEIIFGWGMASAFDADGGSSGDGQQHIWAVNGARVYKSDMSYIDFHDTDFDFIMEDMTDNSVDGDARARFETGVWSLELHDPGNAAVTVADISGTVEWYREDAHDSFEQILGEGWITWNIANFDALFWDGVVFDVSDTNKKLGMRTVLTSFGGPKPEHYQADWATTNSSLMIYTDQSMVPEPATMGLLGIGSLVLMMRRRRA